MKTFTFTSIRHIDAETEEAARELFADESWNFAAEADVEETPPMLKRDRVVSIDENGNDLVGVYYADEDGSENLFSCSPELADKIIALWNTQK